MHKHTHTYAKSGAAYLLKGQTRTFLAARQFTQLAHRSTVGLSFAPVAVPDIVAQIRLCESIQRLLTLLMVFL